MVNSQMLQKGFFFFFFDRSNNIIFVLLMPALFEDGFDFILKLNSIYLVLGNFGDQFPLRGRYLYDMPFSQLVFCITLPCMLLSSFLVRLTIFDTICESDMKLVG